MAEPAIKISAELTGLEKSAQKALANIEKNTRLKIQVDDKASLPLGKISKNASELESSLDAATSRVIAFGAAAAVFTGIAKTFDVLVNSIIEVEDALAKINVNFGATQTQLKSFGKEVFNAARNTAKTFEEAAKAAEELARQGLGTDETIKRLNDALILSRRAGIDSAEAVDTLTAAFNSFRDSGLDTTQIINKLVAVDTRFAVSTKDLSDAISRAASTAQEAGVSFDEFLGIVTAVQQTTARGGAVIGNALKTIFTRVQAAPETLKALEQLGVAITDSSGAFTSAGDRLKQYAQIRQTLSEGDRAYYDRIISGTQQINILSAALNDLAKANSIAGQAQKISSQATDEAIAQNQELNQTLKAIISQTGTNFVEIFSKIGDEASGGLKSFLNGEFGLNRLLELIIDSKGAIEGLGNVLTTGLIAGFVTAVKVSFEIFGNLRKALAAVAGLNDAQNLRLQIEKQIAAVTANATSEELKQLNAATSLAERRAAYLSIEQRVTAELTKQAALNSSLAQSLSPSFIKGAGGVVSDLAVRPRRIPNFADPLRMAIDREKASGVPANQIYIDSDPRLKGPGNPMGLMVANKIDEPLGGFQGVNRALRQGANPRTNGVVPNFAEFDNLQFYAGAKQTGFTNFNLPQDRAKELRRLFIRFRQSRDINEVQSLAAQIKSFSSSNKLTAESAKEIDTKIKGQLGRVEKLRKVYRGGVNPFGERGSGANVPDELDSGPSGQRGLDPGERTRQIQTTGQRAALTLQRERAAGASEELRKRAANLLAQGIVPNEKEILSIRKKVEALAARQLKDDPEFSGFIEKGKFTKDAPPELQKLFKDRVSRNLSSFDSALDSARERAVGARDQKLISRSFDRFDIGFSGKRDTAIRNRLLGKVTPENRQLVEEAFRSRQERRGQKIQNASLGAAFAAPFLAGFIPEGKGGTGSGVALGGASGALQGVGFGALFGPVGAGVGAIAGALVGAFSKLKKSAEEVAETFSDGIRISSDSISKAQAVLQNNEVIENLKRTGGNPELLRKLQIKNSGLIASVESSGIKEALLTGVSEAVTAAIDKEASKQDKENTLRQLSSLGKIDDKNIGQITSLLSLLGGPNGRGIDPAGSAQKFLNVKDQFTTSYNPYGPSTQSETNERKQARENLLAVAQISLGPDVVKNFGNNYELLAKALINSSKAAKEATDSQVKLNQAVKNLVTFADVNLGGESALGKFGSSSIGLSSFGGRARQFDADLSFIESSKRLEELGLKPGTDFQQEVDKATARSQREKSLIAAESFLSPFARERGISLRDDSGNINQLAATGLLKTLGGSSDKRISLQSQLLLGGINEKQATYETMFGGAPTYSTFAPNSIKNRSFLISPDGSKKSSEEARKYITQAGLDSKTDRFTNSVFGTNSQDFSGLFQNSKLEIPKLFDEQQQAFLSKELNKMLESTKEIVSKLGEFTDGLNREVKVFIDLPEGLDVMSEEDRNTLREIALRTLSNESRIGNLEGKPRPPIIKK